jgi:kumamolisin
MRQASNRRIAGSGVAHLPDAAAIAPVEQDLVLQITLVLRPENRRAHRPPSAMHPAKRRLFSHADLAAHYDPGDDRIALVQRFAERHRLEVVEVSRARHDVVVQGTVEQLSRAFGVTLRYFDAAGCRYHAHDERAHLPAELRPHIENVLGLDNIPTHGPHAVARRAVTGFAIADLERQYAFPAVDATAQRIALIEFGGGYFPADIEAYTRHLKLAHPARVTAVSVTSAANQPVPNAPLAKERATAISRQWKPTASFADLHTTFGADLGAFMESLEVTMDIELALALGAGAAVDVYFAPSGVDGWRRALYAAIGLPVGGASAGQPPPATVLSISWGESEAVFGISQLRTIERTLNAVQRAGVAVCCSSGDWGSANSAPAPGAHPNVNFPASSTAVLSCGGTRILARGQEVAWDERVLGTTMATGGGVSGIFKRPTVQRKIKLRPAKGTWVAAKAGDAARRLVPDVAANAAWSSGPAVVYAGNRLIGFGTSAATPICAALLARVSAAVGHRMAGIHSWLYTPDAAGCTRAVTRGDNDTTRGAVAFYRAGPGWNACTGLGTLDGERLVSALSAKGSSTKRSTTRRRRRSLTASA